MNEFVFLNESVENPEWFITSSGNIFECASDEHSSVHEATGEESQMAVK